MTGAGVPAGRPAGAWHPGAYLRFAGERARPFVELLARLDDDVAAAFTAACAAPLRAAHPPRPDGTTLLSFRRVFTVGTRPSGE
ncbi:hypothetical protein QOZ88_15510 [Blastococcus sp. BMG 814]|uniref:SAM-dependent methyltransferase n=1 Tax=Blastococcus carthaginiensis TaxID=3050034 RepID=A0ABT9IFX9_9ACTN|nr:hypothetical protein [Blastococcus carthaginiensis]MDP5184044.1 hypothetical protein [Blastococcus carthaginiensis]